jgi:hypothetical protein
MCPSLPVPERRRHSSHPLERTHTTPEVFYADLTTQLDAKPLAGGPTLRPGQGLDPFNDVQAVDHLAEGHVLAVEPLRLAQRDEELGAVRVRPAIGHGHDAGARVLEVEVLVVELRAVDGLGASAIVVCEVPAVDDELLHHAMEEAALVPVTLFTSAQRSEVLSGHGRDVRSQLYHDPAERGAVRRQVKVNLRQGWGRREAGSHDALVCHGLAATVVQRDTTSDCCSQARTRFRRYTENKFGPPRAHPVRWF